MELLENSNSDSIRQELSELSFEALIKLKEEIGAKIYNEQIRGSTSKTASISKRENKNRPREVSSKLPVSLKPQKLEEPKKKEDQPRDPRFDSKCGEFDEKLFHKRYDFLSDVKEKEKQKLYTKLRKVKNPEMKMEIKKLIQRIESKELEQKRREHKEKLEKEEKDARKAALKEGKKVFYYKKSEKKLMELFDNYENLKKNGKLEKHIERKAKNKKASQRRKLESLKRFN